MSINKLIITSLLSFIFLLLTVASIGQSKNYAVEIGAFDVKVELNYFHKMSESLVYEVLDVNDIYRYWIDSEDKESAELLRQKAIDKGFIHARIIDFRALEEHCKASCGYTPPRITNYNKKRTSKTSSDKFNLKDDGYVIPTKEDFEKLDNNSNVDLAKPDFFNLSKDKIECLFYDYKSPYLREKSKKELDRIASVLLQNKKLKVNIYAHTDANGSDAYNYKLSKTRATIVHLYLVWRGVEDTRISNGPFGERRPIALNKLKDGSDIPSGRQLNRRVEIVIIDEDGKELDLVKPIVVPSKLKIH